MGRDWRGSKKSAIEPSVASKAPTSLRQCAPKRPTVLRRFPSVKSLDDSVLIVGLSGEAAVIKLIVVSLAITSFASGAQAQLAPFGAVPTVLNPYPFIAPAPPTDAGANSGNGQPCGPVYTGRGGARYPCASDDPRQHPK
jgi:hypothetical protein